MAIDNGDNENGHELTSKTDKTPVVWKPKGSLDHHQLEIIRNKINLEFGVNLNTYFELHKWSCENYDIFWEFLWRYFKVIFSEPPALPVIDKSIPMDQIPKWFTGAKLNYAENLLRYPDDKKLAYYYTSERFDEVGIKSKTFGQLRRRVAFMAKALRDMGVTSGDRVAGYLPNFPESIELMAATSSIGAVWSSTSPDFGVSAVLDRFKQIEPKVLFSVEAVSYNGKKHDNLEKLKNVACGIGNKLEKVVVIPFATNRESDIDLSSVFGDNSRVCFLSEFLGPDSENPNVPPPPLLYEQVPFNHPLFIMFSSGTTGAPKCMVHSVGGTLMKHLEEHQIQGNRSPSDVLLYYTTVGWMMWNWMVTALSLGTTLVLYDGSPLVPRHGILFDLVDKCGITVFGTSAKFIAVLEDKEVRPRQTHSLNSLKTICSTGSPLMPHSFDYIYRDIKEDVHVASISGGTDIIACFMGENSVIPVHRGEIQSPHLGCAIECWDEDGNPIIGESGELVCTKPFPSMPVYFWNDPDGKLYRNAYFDKYPEKHIWAHGDFVQIDEETRGLIMLGRSDGTLNPNGVRFGSAEIYSILETFDEISDSLCVGQRSPDRNNEERVILFLKMESGQNLTEDIIQRIKRKIRTELSARHVPALFLPISDIPYTVNGKKVEVAVKNILVGKEVKNATALINPKSLELYKNIPETKVW